ncbi:MAG: sulfatase [Planctomycetes bacterium]|nr:sulfatase [Planctomycetota bacterium]
MFAASSGMVVLATDPAMSGGKAGVAFALGCVGVAILAICIYTGVGMLCRALGEVRFKPVRNLITGAGALVILTTGYALLGSPFLRADGYSVRPPAPTSIQAGGTNVVWVVLDTVRADHVGCYGFDAPTTPFLDEWSSRATLFERCYSNAIWTIPSHTSMFTGLSVRQHGANANHAWLDEQTPTVAEQFSEAGYSTIAFSNNPWVVPDTNLVKGFKEFRAMHRLHALTGVSLERLAERWGVTPPLPWLDGDFGAALTNHAIARWLDSRSAGDPPFLMFINYMEAHLPYRVPRRYRRIFMTAEQVDRSYDLRWSVFGNVVPALNDRYNDEGSDFVSLADREILRLQYQAAIRYLDDRLHELMDLLEQAGRGGDTLIVVTSDHGEYLDTHDMWSHCYQTYNDVAHVPLIIREPGQSEGRRVSTPVQPSDLYPTLINAALGLSERGPGYYGRDLIELANGGDTTRMAVVEYYGPGQWKVEDLRRLGDPVLDHRAQPQFAVGGEQFKFLVSEDGVRELYDISIDPGELDNLIGERVYEVRRMHSYLKTWLEQIPKYVPSVDSRPKGMSEKTRDALRGLGYLGDE